MILSKKKMSDMVRKFIKTNFETMQDAAQSMGCSKQFLSQVCNGHKAPSKKILDAMGLKVKKIVAVKYEVSKL